MTQPVRSETIKRTVVYVYTEIQDLVPTFLSHQLEDVKSIVEACEQRAYEKIQSLGHHTKGVGSAY